MKINYKSPETAAAIAAMASGVVTHAFALVSPLHNYDNILQQPTGYGAGVTFGRWFLSVLGDLNTKILDLGYNLPVVNGLALLVMVALSSALLVNLLRIRNRTSAILLGCLMATFPTAGATLAFRYAAGYYSFGLLLSILAAWVLDKGKLGLPLSALCTALSLGIYQAYTPVTIGIFVLMLMRASLEEDAKLSKLILQGVYDCVALLLGVMLYFLLLKAAIAVYSKLGTVVLDTYAGIDSMGELSLAELPSLIKRAWLSAALFSVKDYCRLVSTAMLKLLWTALVLTNIGLTVYLLIRKKTKPLLAVFCCLMGLLFPLAINFQVIMGPDSFVYTIMVYSFALVGCVPLMLLELVPESAGQVVRKLPKVVALLLAGIIFYNGYTTNFNYSALHYANRHVENYISGLITQIRMTEGFTPEKKWAFFGEIEDPLLYDTWFFDNHSIYGGFIGSEAKGLLGAEYSFNYWIYSYIGYETPYVSREEGVALSQDPRVKQMPCWPSEGSIQIVDDVVVVKFQETDEMVYVRN